MTKRERIATHFQVPVETIRYEWGVGWWCHDQQNRRRILLGKSFYEVQSTPDWALKRITWTQRTTMKVVFLMLAEIDIGHVDTGLDPIAAAQETLDGFRESSLPSEHGIFLHRIGLKEMPSLNDDGVLFT